MLRIKRMWCAAITAIAVIAGMTGQVAAADTFVQAQGTQFTLDGEPFYITGVNNHYLPWGSAAEVTRVLDAAVAMGANVVRTFLGPMIGSPDGTTMPTIWPFHNDQADSDHLNVHGNYLTYWDPATHSMVINTGANGMQKIDFLIAEAAKRHLKLDVAFTDFWSYTGDSQQMRAWYGSQDEKRFFFSDPRSVADYKTWVGFVIQRVNPMTGVQYGNDPTIFAWELMNEAQVPVGLLKQWTRDMSAYVKLLDRNHLVGSGGDAPSMADFIIPTIDFVTWHGYPRYRGITPIQFDALIRNNCALGRRYDKPVLLEEFGFARSNSNPDQAQAYQMWLNTMRNDPDCAGWMVWRLVGPQDGGQYPDDAFDQFDVHQDGGATWQVLSTAAHQGRTMPEQRRTDP
jgi:mannan endo-1,4-beta-mannosidase